MIPGIEIALRAVLSLPLDRGIQPRSFKSLAILLLGFHGDVVELNDFSSYFDERVWSTASALFYSTEGGGRAILASLLQDAQEFEFAPQHLFPIIKALLKMPND